MCDYCYCMLQLLLTTTPTPTASHAATTTTTLALLTLSRGREVERFYQRMLCVGLQSLFQGLVDVVQVHHLSVGTITLQGSSSHGTLG